MANRRYDRGPEPRVLLTGATGFLGRRCLKVLQREGWTVHATTSRPPGPEIAEEQRHCGNMAWWDADGVRWHHADLLNELDIEIHVRLTKPTHLLHLAWHAKRRNLYKARANDTWGWMALELLNYFSSENGKRMVMAGSSAEYDWSIGGVYSESDKRTSAEASTLYAATKASLGGIAMDFAAVRDVSPAWGRLFSLYGPGEPRGKLVASTIRTLLAGKEVRVPHGRQVRDFLYVDDAAEAIVALLASDVEGAVNIGTGQPTPLAAVVYEVARQLDCLERVRFDTKPSPSDEAPLVVADITRLRDEVGYTPQVDLTEGIRRSIAWWRAHRR